MRGRRQLATRRVGGHFNLLLLRQGYPPVILPATQRQRYYDALKQNDDKVAGLIHNALGASIESTIAFLEENGVEA